ncbi:Metallo-dependent phosphatase-like protein [Nemania sp. FL0031]|nr:Metallo-dependent phosphatase-like protein [Nemania sp. FL0031]
MQAMASALPSQEARQRTRKTRFVCISDTHNCTVKLPKGDVLIHCGDLTNQGSFTELEKQVKWLEAADFECKIVVAGNHDLTLDSGFYGHNKMPQILEECQALLTKSKTITYLVHESRTIKLTSQSGPQTTFSVFGSPYSAIWGRAWAFQYTRLDEGNMAARNLWGQIPLDTDILITHGPPRTHCDSSRTGESAGCEILRQELWRVRPRLALCGHIHEGRGTERVRWNLDKNPWQPAELGRTKWQDPDPESNKNALVDLTAKGGNPLDNDGSNGLSEREIPREQAAREPVEKDKDGDVVMLSLGGNLGSGSNSALAGRLGRRETCVVNCAIQQSSYPHAGHGPRKLNKAIVVDLDLPFWGEDLKLP